MLADALLTFSLSLCAVKNMNAYCFLLAFAVFAAVASAFDTLPLHARGGLAWQLQSGNNPAHNNKENALLLADNAQWYTQTLDHFTDVEGTFQQKYYVLDEYYKNDIIYLYISGEGPLSGIGESYVTQLAEDQGAMVVSLEHRFYGDSIPNNSTVTANMQWLTVEQALADLNQFIDFVRQDLGTDTSKVVIVGGSYAGALSAWFKITYPDQVVGAWSSSGVVNAILKFDMFDTQIGHSAGADCTTAMQAVTAQITTAFAAGQNKEVKTLFNSRPGLADNDFWYMVADSMAMAVQYGNKANMCDVIVPAFIAGEDMITVFANFTNSFWGDSFGSDCFYDSICLQNDTSFARSWRWQKCYELAYFQIAPEQNSIRSTDLTYNVLLHQCEVIFGESMKPATNRINNQYGGAVPVGGSNIVFTDFSDDPWQQASVLTNISNTEPFLFAKCDGCGHCADIYTPTNSDPANLQQLRTQLKTIISGWLN